MICRTSLTTALRWSKLNQHHLTHALLTLIDGNAVWKVALGFDKGAVEGPSTQGKKLVEHHRVIGKLLLFDDPSGRWSVDKLDVNTLGMCIKNRICTYVVPHFLLGVQADHFV